MYMAKIQIRTTIDITDTGVKRPEMGSEKEYNQYRNFTTFMQVCGLRSIFSVVEGPKLEKDEWVLVIETDRESVYAEGSDPVKLLKDDLDQVPIIKGLNEVKDLKHPVIKTSGKTPNTFVSVLQ